MITQDTVVVNTPPRISPDTFEQVLIAAGSPAQGAALEGYASIVGTGVCPAFILAVFKQESNFATDPASMVVKYKTNNPGNCRSSSIGDRPIKLTERGQFVIYNNWIEGFLDAANRLVDKDFPYYKEDRKTIGQIIERWAPSEDGNDTQKYINNIVQFMSEWIGQEQSQGGTGIAMQNPTTQVHLIPGHAGRGRDGVTPALITLHVQEGTNDLYSEFANRPPSNAADCTIWSKQDGSLVRLLNDSDTPWTNGDVVAPDMTNPIIAGLINAGVTNTNRYSYTVEHQGYAAKGFTDAQIEATAKMCAYWCAKEGWSASQVDIRIVGHYQVGNHKNCPGPLFPWAKLKARVKELLGGGVDKVTNTNDGPKPANLPYGVTVDSAGALIFPGNIPLNFGFKDAYLTLFGNVAQGDDLGAAIIRGAKVFGLPVAPEVANDTGSTQEFELSIFRYNKTEAPGWQVRLYKKPTTTTAKPTAA